MSGNDSKYKLTELNQRAIHSEQMMNSLQKQLNYLQSHLPSKKQISTNPSNENKSNNIDNQHSIQPDSTFPPWHTPYNPCQTRSDPIMVLNSLVPSTKVPFVPNEGKLVKWYTCGPTVYAPSHMGHARTYITFDIIRNILEYYFGYRVNLVMNITDVDDKIILRARQNFLFDMYANDTKTVDVIIEDLNEAFQYLINKRKEDLLTAEQLLMDAKHKKDMEDNLMGAKVKLSNVMKDFQSYENLKQNDNILIEKILKIGKTALSAFLDKEKGEQVKDQLIFRAHAQKYEQEFFDDMRMLNVRDPDIITRVTEFIPQIITFVENLIDNGYAYESNGSVYFDLDYYRKNHDFPKLDPMKIDNKLLMEEAEGALSNISDINKERKTPRDFAVWKKSKSGEPQWMSPWGYGRPGWHIECSVMATQVLGNVLDIHTGGMDLKFPHHDNEMAQSCAFYSTSNQCSEPYFHKQWVNYWFHTGHLHINNLKMSKSLKNFITIRQALKSVSTRQIRILFLMQSWTGTMNYSDQSLETCKVKEHHFNEFFLLINALNREYNHSSIIASTDYTPNAMDYDLNNCIMKRELEVDHALRDNFDYKTAVQCLCDLMNDINKYLNVMNKMMDGGKKRVPNILLINKASDFINEMLKIFGVVSQTDAHFLGNNYKQREAYLTSILDVITNYRNNLAQLYRNNAQFNEYSMVVNDYQEQCQSFINEEEKKGDENERNDCLLSLELIEKKKILINILLKFNEQMIEYVSVEVQNRTKDILALLDNLRDEQLFANDVKLEDIEGGKGSFWKLYENGFLEKMKIEQNKMFLKSKCEKRIKYLMKEIEQWRKKSLSVVEYFQTFVDEKGDKLYSAFDGSGIPTHDQNGNELSANLRKKKLAKLAKKQTKNRLQFDKKLKKNDHFFMEMEEELNEKNELLKKMKEISSLNTEEDENEC